MKIGREILSKISAKISAMTSQAFSRSRNLVLVQLFSTLGEVNIESIGISAISMPVDTPLPLFPPVVLKCANIIASLFLLYVSTMYAQFNMTTYTTFNKYKYQV